MHEIKCCANFKASQIMMATTWMMGEHLKNSYDGQLKEKYYNAQFDNDFSRMRNHVNQLLEKEETERRIRRERCLDPAQPRDIDVSNAAAHHRGADVSNTASAPVDVSTLRDIDVLNAAAHHRPGKIARFPVPIALNLGGNFEWGRKGSRLAAISMPIRQMRRSSEQHCVIKTQLQNAMNAAQKSSKTGQSGKGPPNQELVSGKAQEQILPPPGRNRGGGGEGVAGNRIKG
nr:protein argonaute 10 [Ipomoea batatas]